jgi:hypothetical protein
LATGGGAGKDAAVICDCAGAVCGVDECGQTCGSCGGGEVCLDRACKPLSKCDQAGLVAPVASALARTTDEGTTVRYEALSADVEPFDKVVIELRRPPEGGGAAEKPGVYGVGVESWADCEVCVVAYRGCHEGTCDRSFIADGGQLALSATGFEDVRLTGELVGLLLREVYLDPKTQKFYPIPNGEAWCLESHAFDLEVERIAVGGSCLAAGTGKDIGDHIGNFQVIDCEGNPVELHSKCGAKAIELVATAGWCTACDAYLGEVKARYDAYYMSGYEFYVMLGEDADGAEPSLEFCTSYAEKHGFAPNQVYVDWGDPEGGWANTFAHINNYADGSIGLPWIGLFDGQDLGYQWADEVSDTDFQTELEGLLGP